MVSAFAETISGVGTGEETTEERHIRVLAIGFQPGDLASELADISGGVRLSFQYHQAPLHDELPSSLWEGSDAVILSVGAERQPELSQSLVNGLPLVVVLNPFDPSTAMRLIAQGVGEVIPSPEGDGGRLSYAIQAAITRFQRTRQMLEPVDGLGDTIERKALSTLDRLPFGVMFLNAEAEVLFLNSTARAVIDGESGLSLSKRNQCTAVDPNDTAALRRMIKKVAREGEAYDGGYAMRIGAGEEHSELSLLAVPVGSNPSGGVALFLNGNGGVFDISGETIKSVYGFTDSEAELVLGLVQGLTLSEIAEERMVTLHTVRAQLKSIFIKTGVKRQAVLIKQILTGPAVLMRH